MNFRTSCVLPQPPIPITANIHCWPMRKSSPKKNCESWSNSLVLPTKLDDAVGQRGAGALLTSVGGGYALTVRLPCPLFVISPMLWENMAPPAESILEKEVSTSIIWFWDYVCDRNETGRVESERRRQIGCRH